MRNSTDRGAIISPDESKDDTCQKDREHSVPVVLEGTCSAAKMAKKWNYLLLTHPHITRRHTSNKDMYQSTDKSEVLNKQCDNYQKSYMINKK